MATVSVINSKQLLSSEIFCGSKTFDVHQKMLKPKLKIQPKPKERENQKQGNIQSTDTTTVTKLPNSGFGQNPGFSKGKRVLAEIYEDNSVVTNTDYSKGVSKVNYQKRQKLDNVKPVSTTTTSCVNPSCGSVNRQGDRPTDISRDSNVDNQTGKISSKDNQHSFHPATPTISDARGKVQETIDHDAQMSPKKALRVAMMKSRFADIILKSKNELLLNGKNGASIKMQYDKESLEQKQKEAKIKDAAEVASKKSQQAKLKSHREREREAARIALENMVKTAEIYECEDVMRDFEMLISGQPPINVGLVLKTDHNNVEEEQDLNIQGEKDVSLKMHHEKELSVVKQKEAKSRVAAEVASKKNRQAKLKSQREREREASRIALENMVKTAEICECENIMRDYEMLISGQPRINLGLVLKPEYICTEEEEYLNGDDVEEGEIIS